MTMPTAAPVDPSGADRPPLLEARDISKYFGAVVALEGVSLEVRAGEINCLLGDNGAGKSTLIKTLSGVHPPDEGTLAIDGEPVTFGVAARCTQRRHRDRLPGPLGHAPDEHQPQLLPRQRADRRVRAVQAVRCGQGRARRQGGDAQHRDRRARHGTTRRHPVRRRAPDPGDRAGRVLRGQGPDPRRADVRARRQGIGDRPAPCDRRPEQGPRGHLHHAQRPARAADRRLVHHPDPRPIGRDLPAWRAQRRAAPRDDGRRDPSSRSCRPTWRCWRDARRVARTSRPSRSGPTRTRWASLGDDKQV